MFNNNAAKAGGTASGPSAGSYEANENLRAWQRRQGDCGSTVRTLLHYAYPEPSAATEARAALICELESRGFIVDDVSTMGGLTFRHEAAPATGGFDRTTKQVAALMAKYGWVYDAWENAPVSDPALMYWQQIDGSMRDSRAA